MMRRCPFIPHSRPRFRRGFNLIEAAIVLGVVGLVIGGIWVAAAAVSDRMKQNQLVEGWGYFSRQISENFPRTVMSKITADTDIESMLVSSIPMPAGWTVGGPWNIHPVDPYGNPLYLQVQANGETFYMGYTGQTISGSACQAVLDYILGTLVKTYKPNYFSIRFGNPACTVDSSNYTSYSSNKLETLRTCCPSTTLAMYMYLQ